MHIKLMGAIVFCALLLFALNSNLTAETPIVWGDLSPGQYAVGFKTFEKFDHSRTFQPKTDYFGEKIEGIRARPVQACLWYPAAAQDDEMSMNYGEYMFAYPEDDRLFNILSAIQNREIQMLFSRVRDQNIMLTISNTLFAAVRDAQPAEGKFPLVIYHPDIGGIYCNNAVLCEFLASHGYAVLSASPLGMKSVNVDEDHASLEFQARDKEFAWTLVKDQEFIDFDRLALVGANSGGLMALEMQMRNTDVDAMVSIEGWLTQADKAEFCKNSPFLDPIRMHKPFLHISIGPQEELDYSLFESLKYSDRTLIHWADLPGDGFVHYPMFTLLMSDEIKTMTASVREAHEDICELVLAFLNENIKDESSAQDTFAQLASNVPSAEIKSFTAQELPPTPNQFIRIVESKGVDKALEIFQKFHELEPERVFFQERRLNLLGYQALNRGQVEDAIKLFKMNTAAYPSSCNTWDSLSDGYMAANDTENAIKCMKKVLETIPIDTVNDDQLKAQLKEKCERMLNELQG
ncbi:MAG: hypothetical protein GF310_02060 [candidate division Zixibacteria bacterium]|nr:hypothetical protein [candidate division Zixibacteria bacterium]